MHWQSQLWTPSEQYLFLKIIGMKSKLFYALVSLVLNSELLYNMQHVHLVIN